MQDVIPLALHSMEQINLLVDISQQSHLIRSVYENPKLSKLLIKERAFHFKASGSHGKRISSLVPFAIYKLSFSQVMLKVFVACGRELKFCKEAEFQVSARERGHIRLRFFFDFGNFNMALFKDQSNFLLS